MKTAHMNMKVTEGEFGALVEDLVGALNKFNVPEREKNDLLGLLAPLKPLIVEVNSNATGTALPGNFKPAPPLTDKKKMDKKMGKKAGSQK
jgi:hemoglobin